MGLQAILEKQYKQTAVYWGNPVSDGEGGFTFDNPVEILCRWEDIRQVVTDNKGNSVVSRAVIFIKQDLDEEGMIYLGTLENLYDLAESSAEAIDNPKDFANTYIIKRFGKVPSLQISTEFIRTAYLTPSLSFGGF